MTFGRPSMIHESYIKLDMPLINVQVLGSTPQPDPGPHMDGMYYTATL